MWIVDVGCERRITRSLVFVWQLLNQGSIVNRFGIVTVFKRPAARHFGGRLYGVIPHVAVRDAPLHAAHSKTANAGARFFASLLDVESPIKLIRDGRAAGHHLSRSLYVVSLQ